MRSHAVGFMQIALCGKALKGEEQQEWACLRKDGVIGCHDSAPDDVQAFAVAWHQHPHMVGVLDKGEPRVLRVLHVWRQHRVPQQVDTVQDHCRGAHDLDQQHIPAVGHIWAQVEGLGDTDPEVEDEGAKVEEEDYASQPVDLGVAYVPLELPRLRQAHEWARLGLCLVWGVERSSSILALSRWRYGICRHYLACIQRQSDQRITATSSGECFAPRTRLYRALAGQGMCCHQIQGNFVSTYDELLK